MASPSQPSRPLLDQVHARARARHCSRHTEELSVRIFHIHRAQLLRNCDWMRTEGGHTGRPVRGARHRRSRALPRRTAAAVIATIAPTSSHIAGQPSAGSCGTLPDVIVKVASGESKISNPD